MGLLDTDMSPRKVYTEANLGTNLELPNTRLEKRKKRRTRRTALLKVRNLRKKNWMKAWQTESVNSKSLNQKVC